ncbi:MAG: insulinase family protein [Saprospiraceae bacterium]|nr:insulinase family protein [Saprospiraceae bacterium]
MIRNYLCLFLCCLIGIGTSTAQLNSIKFEKYTLPNGLKVILHQDKSTPIVTVSVMYHVGSKNESPDRTGFAHFFEHLLFEGSKNIKRGEFDKYIQNAGGTNNANTTWDRTYYYEVLPSNQLGVGLWLESERMMHAKVEKIGIETQRQVVKEERRQRIDNQPYGTVVEESMKRAFKKHPYQWPVIGSMAHLDAATDDDYVNFYKTYYVPNNAILCVAGDLDIASTKEMIAKYFSTIPRGKNIVKPNIVEPPLGGEVRDTFYDNIQLPAVIQTYRIPGQGTEDYYAVQMLGMLMSQGGSSRLSKALVDEQQKAVAVGNFPLPMEDPGAALCYGIANMGISPLDLEKSMDEEIQKVQTQLISDEELQKLKNQIENDFVGQNATMEGVAETLANYEMYFGDANLINTELNRYLKVTKEDIQRVANKYYQKNNRVSLIYLPKSAKP